MLNPDKINSIFFLCFRAEFRQQQYVDVVGGATESSRHEARYGPYQSGELQPVGSQQSRVNILITLEILLLVNINTELDSVVDLIWVTLIRRILSPVYLFNEKKQESPR